MTVADAFTLFKKATHGGSAIPAFVYSNDVHPTPLGQWLLSEAVEAALRDGRDRLAS